MATKASSALLKCYLLMHGLLEVQCKTRYVTDIQKHAMAQPIVVAAVHIHLRFATAHWSVCPIAIGPLHQRRQRPSFCQTCRREKE